MNTVDRNLDDLRWEGVTIPQSLAKLLSPGVLAKACLQLGHLEIEWLSASLGVPAEALIDLHWKRNSEGRRPSVANHPSNR